MSCSASKRASNAGTATRWIGWLPAVDVRLWGRGARSGVEVDQRFAVLYSLDQDGMATSARLLPDVATAIATGEAAARQS